jgi:uncharacterized protein YdbL (DUF1318 family)
MKKLIALTIALITITSAAFAGNLDLSSAKDQGLVGETSMGLIEAVKGASSDVNELVSSTNAGRMEVYKNTASEQGISVSEVQALAAQKLFGMASKGHYLKTSSGWIQK